jgi:hypothetical protein
MRLGKAKKEKKKPKKVVKKKGRKKNDFVDDEVEDEDSDEDENVKMPFSLPLLSSAHRSSSIDTKEDMLNRPPPKEALDMAATIKERLLAQIELLGNQLPPNTLDQLIDELGGPENVAEMTGRKGRVVQNDNGQVFTNSL